MTQTELMDLIFEKPAMFLGHASVFKMQAFVEGFGFAFIDENGTHIDETYSKFNKWIVDRYRTGQYPWSSIVTMIGVSEQRSFEVAKELWQEYKKEIVSK